MAWVLVRLKYKDIKEGWFGAERNPTETEGEAPEGADA